MTSSPRDSLVALTKRDVLWRIFRLADGRDELMKNIVGIGRPDSLSLLRDLGGGDILKAVGKMALACDMAAVRDGQWQELKEATLIRIHEIIEEEKDKKYSARLSVLYRKRVQLASEQPYPTARILPDMIPIWRIHRHGSPWDSQNLRMETKRIENISRADTIAIFKSLGDGDVRNASGKMILTCDYEDELKDGMAAVITRIEDIKGSTDDSTEPPFSCSIRVLGRILCTTVVHDAPGDYPQAVLGMVPIWKIHNFNSSDDIEHNIGKIIQ